MKVDLTLFMEMKNKINLPSPCPWSWSWCACGCSWESSRSSRERSEIRRRNRLSRRGYRWIQETNSSERRSGTSCSARPDQRRPNDEQAWLVDGQVRRRRRFSPRCRISPFFLPPCSPRAVLEFRSQSLKAINNKYVLNFVIFNVFIPKSILCIWISWTECLWNAFNLRSASLKESGDEEMLKEMNTSEVNLSLLTRPLQNLYHLPALMLSTSCPCFAMASSTLSFDAAMKNLTPIWFDKQFIFYRFRISWINWWFLLLTAELSTSFPRNPR